MHCILFIMYTIVYNENNRYSQINTILYKYCELLVGIKKRVIIYEKENIKILINYLDIIAYYIIRKYIQVKLIGVNFIQCSKS